jgi:glucose/arabinose dehydrogenase
LQRRLDEHPLVLPAVRDLDSAIARRALRLRLPKMAGLSHLKPGGKDERGGGSDAGEMGRKCQLANVQDILVADAYTAAPAPTTRGRAGPAVRLAFDSGGLLYVSLGDRNFPPKAQDPGSHIGKILRIRDDGTVPPDNPFVKTPGYKPEIYTLGHRNPLGLAFNPINGELWSSEEGPQGGDELNLIQAGKNYGWPRVSLGRNYDGTRVGEGFTAPGLEEPVVYWVPAIAVSGLSFYNGDKFPAWKGNAFVGAMRNNTGQHIQRVQFNAQGNPTGRELMLGELKQRIREVKPGPDGFMRVDRQDFGAVLRSNQAVTGSRRGGRRCRY